MFLICLAMGGWFHLLYSVKENIENKTKTKHIYTYIVRFPFRVLKYVEYLAHYFIFSI